MGDEAIPTYRLLSLASSFSTPKRISLVKEVGEWLLQEVPTVLIHTSKCGAAVEHCRQ